jgi:hypothetical protein
MDEVAMASRPRALGEALQNALRKAPPGDDVKVTAGEATRSPEHAER